MKRATSVLSLIALFGTGALAQSVMTLAPKTSFSGDGYLAPDGAAAPNGAGYSAEDASIRLGIGRLDVRFGRLRGIGFVIRLLAIRGIDRSGFRRAGGVAGLRREYVSGQSNGSGGGEKI